MKMNKLFIPITCVIIVSFIALGLLLYSGQTEETMSDVSEYYSCRGYYASGISVLPAYTLSKVPCTDEMEEQDRKEAEAVAEKIKERIRKEEEEENRIMKKYCAQKPVSTLSYGEFRECELLLSK